MKMYSSLCLNNKRYKEQNDKNQPDTNLAGSCLIKDVLLELSCWSMRCTASSCRSRCVGDCHDHFL